jgi:hypothetical protein
MLNDKKIYKIRLYLESNLFKLNLSSASSANTFLSCKSFVQFVLSKRLKHQNANDYGLFERVNGIEQLIENSTNIFDLGNLLHKSDTVVYIIRKKSSVESSSNRDKNLTQSQRSKIQRFFKKHAASSIQSHKFTDVTDKYVVENVKEGYCYFLSIRVVTKKVNVYDCRARTKVVDNSIGVLRENYIRSSCNEKIVYIKERLVQF